MSVIMRAPLEIGICVADLDRAAAFYEQVLSFTRMSEATLAADRAEQAGFGPVAFRMVRMQTSYGERIKLLKPEPAPARAVRGNILAQEGISYLTFVVSDLDAALQRLADAGVATLSSGPVQSRPGTRLAFFRDSEGNVLELVQYDNLKAYRPDIAF